MLVSLSSLPAGTIIYPDSDGKPMAENTKQARWIFIFYGNLLALFGKAADVFIAADLFWYAMEGEPEIRQAPDVLVVFGRPKGDRGSYKQWEEAGIPVTVAIEILSPGNSPYEMADKLEFYDEHGVEEYYIYDPDKNSLMIYIRNGAVLRRVRPAHGFVSPRMGIRFDMTQSEMTVYRPDGRPFLSFEQLHEVRDLAELEKKQADERAEKATEEKKQADERAEKATEEKKQADERAEKAERRAELAEQQASRAVAEVERLRRLLGEGGPDE